MNRCSLLHAGADERQAAVVALEFALLVPVLGLLMVAVLLAGIHAVDQVAVQEAARHGARAAATSRTDGPPRAAVTESLGGRDAWVTVHPARRHPGQHVVVSVTHTRDVGWLTWTVSGSARSVVEPGA